MEGSENIFWKKYKNLLILTGVGLLVYFNGLFGAFVYDDLIQVQANSLVHSISSIPGFFLGDTYFPQNSMKLSGLYYKPLFYTVFSLLYFLFGPNPFFFHVTQLLLHILNAILVLTFLKKFLKEGLAFFLSLIFLVHPINVESVAYISGLQEPLFFFFGISALLLYQKEKISIKRGILTSLLLLASIFSKETGILFFIILLLYHLLFKNKQHLFFPLSIILTSPLFVYAFSRLVIAKILFEKNLAVPIMTASLFERLYTMPSIVLFYIKTFFFPKNLLISQQWLITRPTSEFYTSFGIDALVIILIVILGIWIYRKSKDELKKYTFFAMWLLLGIVIHLQFFPLDFTVAERWFYFPFIGIIGMFGVGLQNIDKKYYKFRWVLLLFGILTIVLLSLRTVIRNTNWWNGYVLFSHDLAIVKNDERIENFLALELAKEGRLDEAIVHFQHLLSKNPSAPYLYVNLAIASETKGNITKAESLYEKVLEADKTGETYYNLSRLKLLYEKNGIGAKKLAQSGINKYPANGNLWAVIALSDYSMGNQKEAIEEAKKAYDLTPNDNTRDVLYHILHKDPMEFLNKK
ncbi:tetratricopeptide repeat protein [Patescibacteria group bacterium]|nr:tetratricopeptide repeat protein [Patescibacteria group bacterium]